MSTRIFKVYAECGGPTDFFGQKLCTSQVIQYSPPPSPFCSPKAATLFISCRGPCRRCSSRGGTDAAGPGLVHRFFLGGAKDARQLGMAGALHGIRTFHLA